MRALAFFLLLLRICAVVYIFSFGFWPGVLALLLTIRFEVEFDEHGGRTRTYKLL